MEVELGLKITQTRDDLSSTADLRISKDAGGVLFFSRETEAVFVLTGHLRGYRRKHIDIRINEDGTQIAITGKKPVQEKVIQGWIIYKKEIELKGFTKVFRIPQGVVLDKIKAKFIEDGSVLTISMPKSVKGISGEGIEEVEEESSVQEEPSSNKAADQQEPTDEVVERTEFDPFPERQENNLPENVQTPEKMETELVEPLGGETATDVITEKSELAAEGDEEKEEGRSSVDKEKARDRDKEIKTGSKGRRRKFKVCCPAMVGSVLLVPLIILAINLIKAKQR